MSRRGENRKQAICWGCAKACGKCSWSSLPQKPVKGSRISWFEQRYREQGRIRVETMGRVLKCPEFEEG